MAKTFKNIENSSINENKDWDNVTKRLNAKANEIKNILINNIDTFILCKTHYFYKRFNGIINFT